MVWDLHDKFYMFSNQELMLRGMSERGAYYTMV